MPWQGGEDSALNFEIIYCGALVELAHTNPAPAQCRECTEFTSAAVGKNRPWAHVVVEVDEEVHHGVLHARVWDMDDVFGENATEPKAW